MPTITSGPGAIAVEAIQDQIRAVGVGRVILSSDLGQVDNGPVVAGFARCLGKLVEAGLTEDEIRVMIVDNPKKLLEGRHRTPVS
jgi:predicted metal-dependent phosphotriesterase family hydrolase